MMKLFLSIIAIVVVAAPAHGQIAGMVSVYADAQGTSCNVTDVEESSIVTLYVIHQNASDVSASQFMVTPVNGANMTWLSDISAYTTTGDSHTGIGVDYGGCTSTPGQILTINYFGQGLSSFCSGYDIVASPVAKAGANPGFFAYDCSSNEMLPSGSGVMVNPNVSCACDLATGIGDSPRVSATELQQNYPNPFNPTTTISFTLEQSSRVSLQVFDVSGRVVRDLASEALGPGYHHRHWDGRDNAGRRVASGVYFYRLAVGDFSQVRKMVMLK
jgi:hypothetical protein